MSKTKAERWYMGVVATLPCACCGSDGPVELHHAREEQGTAMKSGDFCVIPLCADCHRGSNGVHGNKTMLRVFKTGEMKMLNETIGNVVRRIMK